MTDTIVVLIDAGNDPVYRWFAPGGGTSMSGGANEVAACFPSDTAITVLLTSAHALLTSVHVKVRNRRLLSSAAAYALEDLLAGDIDDLSFEIGPEQAPDEYAVAGARQEIIEAVTKDFVRAGYASVRCVPYVFALPYDVDHVSCLNDGSVVVVRDGLYSGFTVPLASASAMLQRAIRERGAALPVKVFTLRDADGFDAGPAAVSPTRLTPASFSGWLQGNLDARPALALTASIAGRPVATARKFVAAAALLLAALIVHTGFIYSRTGLNESRLAAVRQETQQLFQSTFPNVKRVVNPKVQAERLIEELRAGTPQGLTFLDGMFAFGLTVAMVPDDTTVKSLRYRAGMFDLTLDAPDLAALERVRAALVADAITAEIVSAENRDTRVIGRLRFEQATP